MAIQKSSTVRKQRTVNGGAQVTSSLPSVWDSSLREGAALLLSYTFLETLSQT